MKAIHLSVQQRRKPDSSSRSRDSTIVTFEFDHLFILTSIGAHEADRLKAIGLTEGTSNVHLGQGTANRRFFFHNAKLELLWVDDSEAAMSEKIRPTYLWQRWVGRSSRACPFGFCLRSTTYDREPAPFSSWDYRPPYLPDPMSIAVGTNIDVLTEPMLFCTPFGQRPDQYSAEKSQPLSHSIGLREMTRVEWVSPSVESLSAEMQAVLDTDLVKLRWGTEQLLELGFDGELQGHQVDLRPALPLILCW